MKFTKVAVPGGMDYVFTGAGIDQLAEMCKISCSEMAAKSGSKFSHTSGNGYVVLSVRGTNTGNCCDDVVQTALVTSGIAQAQS